MIAERLPLDVLDDRGQPSGAPVVLGQRRARIRTLTGGELERARMNFAQASVEFVFRFLPGLKPKDRLRYDGGLYEIGHVNDVEYAHREHRVLCTENR